MNVRELISELKKIKDKTKEVVYACSDKCHTGDKWVILEVNEYGGERVNLSY